MACQHGPDIVASMGSVIDGALARADGPLRSFEHSLIIFAQANYALRLEGGRCATTAFADCGNRHYDPQRIYPDPPLEAELHYGGQTLTYDGVIPASFGMDLIEVKLDQGLAVQPLHIALQSTGARFNVQVWRLGSTRGKTPRALMPQPEPMLAGKEGLYSSTIPRLDPATSDRLALIITRLDADEGADATGSYTIILDPEPVSSDGDGAIASD
jgi:hypothetical protein